MSAEPTPSQHMTEAEYLAFERESEFRHEFVDGEVFMMSGASEAHNLISGDVFGELRLQLRGRNCKVFHVDMKVFTPSTRSFFLPDVTVVCGERKYTDDKRLILLNPTLVIEVLSPSTELYDRNTKFRRYREIASLQEYILVAQDQPRIERFRRQDDDTWLFNEVAGLDARLDLTSIGCVLPLAEVYAQVDFETPDTTA